MKQRKERSNTIYEIGSAGLSRPDEQMIDKEDKDNFLKEFKTSQRLKEQLGDDKSQQKSKKSLSKNNKTSQDVNLLSP